MIFERRHLHLQVNLDTFFPPNSVATLGVHTVAVKAGCSFEVVSCVRGIFDDLDSTNVPSSDVHVHFDCAGSHKPGVMETSRTTSRHFGPLRLLSLW